MEYIGVIIVAALAFGVCFAVDKLFTRLFRSQAQHRSGLSVRHNKKYGAFGIILFALGLAAVFTGLSMSWVVIVGGALVSLAGVALVVYYMTFGIFYDEDQFLVMGFLKKTAAYRYSDIKSQQLYLTTGQILVELYLTNGKTVHIQSGMVGAYPFLDYAFARWCVQKGIQKEECTFYDPANSCWFPTEEEK